MSALARYFKFMDKNVAGYDQVSSPLTAELTDLGIAIHYRDDVMQITGEFRNPNSTLVVYTPAIPKESKELQFFQTQDFSIKKRSEVLGLITEGTYCHAVAGTHGKTTTSCILAHLLHELKVPLTAFLGGVSENFNSNFLWTGTSTSVVEADEYDRSFLQLSPTVACITSMDADHLDIYGSDTELKKTFGEFASKLQPDGTMLVRKGLPLEGLTFGLEEDADYDIQEVRLENGGYRFSIKTPETIVRDVRFSRPGKHNLLNGLAAFAMASQQVDDLAGLADALGTFQGVKRRFTYHIKQDNLIFIDDYAHHPTEIDAVYQAVTEMHPHKKTAVVFQPHLFSRTKDFGPEFAQSLSQFDAILLLEIYPAREKPMEGVHSQWLLDMVENPNKKKISKEKIIEELRAQSPEVIITMGAGDIGLEVHKIKNAFDHEN